MRRATPPFHLLAAAAATDANTAIMFPNKPHRGRGRGFFKRPYSGGREQFVTGDDHFQLVRDVNSTFQRDESGSFANQTRDRNPPFYPRPSPPYHQNPRFRHPSPYNHAQQLHHSSPYNHAQQFSHPSPYNHNQQFSDPSPYNHAQQFRHPPPYNKAQKVRPRPPDYRVWEYAATPPPPHCERFKILSYNILADYLAIDHRSKLYYHIPHWMLDWQWRKRNMLFELGLWSADIMCLQEVDRFHDLEEELKHQGYSGIWKMRTGDPVDGCAIFWRTSRFNLCYEECIEFNKLGLRDNVAQICVLELMNQDGSPSSSLTGSNKVVICNIHVLYNPNRGEIKLGQVRVLLDRAKAVSKIWDDAPVVICGDFNCTPKSPLYNFISEQKLNLSGIDRDKVSGQASAVIRTPRLERSANGSVQDTSIAGNKEFNVEQNIYLSDMQKSDNQGNMVENEHNQIALDMSTKCSTDVLSENGNDASYAEKVIQQTTVIKVKSVASSREVDSDEAGRRSTEQISDAVSSSNPESSSERFNFDIPKENEHTEFDSCSTSLSEDSQSFRIKIDPELSELPSVEISSTKPSSQMSVSDSIETPHLTYTERSSFELTSDDQMSGTLTSYQAEKSRKSTDIDFPLEEKLEKLSLDEMDKDILGSEEVDAFISALHNTQEGFQPSIQTELEKLGRSDKLESASDNLLLHAQSGVVEGDFPSSPNSKSFDAERTIYNPSLWTPREIETATGNSECTFLEHSLPLWSTYIEVKDHQGTRDLNGEPMATSYNRCFLGTVDYIWRSDGLQTVRVLAPIPKHAMELTPGFPTKKWGSDHIALISELVIVKGVTDVSRGIQ